uniref:Uncharacterized protein n=1 Tax=Megaselia scalaris TaxID=36166 RepID=T1GWQ2_MEGSC
MAMEKGFPNKVTEPPGVGPGVERNNFCSTKTPNSNIKFWGGGERRRILRIIYGPVCEGIPTPTFRFLKRLFNALTSSYAINTLSKITELLNFFSILTGKTNCDY